MMKLLAVSVAAVVAVASSQEVVETVEELLHVDLDILPSEAMSRFGSFKTHLALDITAALQTVQHEEVLSSTSFRGLQGQEGDDDKCKHCVDNSEQWIMTYATKAFEKMCSNQPKCPFLKKMCEVYKKHPKVIEGFIFGQVNAHMNALSYCIGKKDCDMPKQMFLGDQSLTSGNGDRGNDMLEALRTLDTVTTDEEFNDADDEEFSQAEDELDNVVSPHDCDCGDSRAPAHLFNDDMSLADKPDKPKPPKCDCICKGCIHHMTKFVLGMTIEKIKHICKDPKSDKVKKMCEWAKAHKEETVGFLFSKVQPWKGAIGWCFGAGRCMPGPHHHHHHHHTSTTPPQEDIDIFVTTPLLQEEDDTFAVA